MKESEKKISIVVHCYFFIRNWLAFLHRSLLSIKKAVFSPLDNNYLYVGMVHELID